jgi:spermidine synthase
MEDINITDAITIHALVLIEFHKEIKKAYYEDGVNSIPERVLMVFTNQYLSLISKLREDTKNLGESLEIFRSGMDLLNAINDKQKLAQVIISLPLS